VFSHAGAATIEQVYGQKSLPDAWRTSGRVRSTPGRYCCTCAKREPATGARRGVRPLLGGP